MHELDRQLAPLRVSLDRSLAFDERVKLLDDPGILLLGLMIAARSETSFASGAQLIGYASTCTQGSSSLGRSRAPADSRRLGRHPALGRSVGVRLLAIAWAVRASPSPQRALLAPEPMSTRLSGGRDTDAAVLDRDNLAGRGLAAVEDDRYCMNASVGPLLARCGASFPAHCELGMRWTPAARRGSIRALTPPSRSGDRGRIPLQKWASQSE